MGPAASRAKVLAHRNPDDRTWLHAAPRSGDVFIPLFILAEWAHRKGKKLEAERIRASDEALYREVYGPAGKPGRIAGSAAESR